MSNGPIVGFRSVRDAKNGFFDRAAVIGAMDATARKVLSKFGAFVRRSAQLSIRTRKGHSPPGSPPHGHVGLLRKFIFFSWDNDRRSVVVGPAKLNGRASSDAPKALEYGGWFNRRGRNGPRVANYPARPFMGPAFDANLPKLPKMWAGALRK